MMNSYSPLLVLASLAISILACWTALELSCRVHAQPNRRARMFWLGSGAFVMGLGIWAMHYVGMLALRTTMPVLYHWPTVVLSFFAAVTASAMALLLVSKATLPRLNILAGGLLMGGGIAAMHYIGMAAMRMPMEITYSMPMVALSLLLAVVISQVALLLCFSAKDDPSPWTKKKVASALLMGIAVPSMHYVGMAAAHMHAPANGAMLGQFDPRAVQVSQLGVTAVIATVTLCIGFALLLARFDRKTLLSESKLAKAKSEHDLLNDHQQRLAKAYRQNGVGAWEWDPLNDSFSIDASIGSIYGEEMKPKGVPRARFLELLHPDDLASTNERWTAALQYGTHYENEYRILHANGDVRRCRSIATVTRHADGTVASVLGMSWDVTAEHQQQQDHAAQAQRFLVTLEAIGEAVISVDTEHRILYANPVACQLTGWQKEECVGKPFTDVFVAIHEVTGEVRRSAVQRCIDLGGSLLSEDGILISRTGARYNIQKHVNLIGDQGAAVVTFQDITSDRLLQHELRFAANHDSLTGLPNRAAFTALLETVWENERRDGRQHCLALLDIDRFKLVNDTAGHLAGDTLLQTIVKAVEPKLRPCDFLARMGGDEFLLLIRDTEAESAQAFCRELLHTVEAIHFAWQQRVYGITASLGMVLFHEGSTSIESLTSQADVALFTAKRNGRNRLANYEESMGEAANSLLEMEAVSEIQHALQQDRFELHAQPIVALSQGTTVPYFEVLIRMRDRNGGLVAPYAFIPAAERYGLMPQLDRWVVREALTLLGEHTSLAPGAHLAVNLSADSLSDPALWNFVDEQFRSTGVPHSAITFEVTESGLIHNLDAAQSFLKLAQAAGCRIALDDFGTGMSSLSYLKQFPLDTIKIDGSFVRKILGTPLDRSIVQAVAQIGHSMGANIVAECAEDMETVDLLRSLNIDYVQGWATGKPKPLLPTLRQIVADQKSSILEPLAESFETLLPVPQCLPAQMTEAQVA